MKFYRVNDEHMDSWIGNGYPVEDLIVTDSEIAELARGWGRTVEELLAEVEELDHEPVWYAVQTDSEDEWGYGSYDKGEAISMMLADEKYQLIAVIENDCCIEEIKREDVE